MCLTSQVLTTFQRYRSWTIISAKGVMYALLPIFLLQFSSLVAGVDISFYERTASCDGTGYTFATVDAMVCCVVSAQDGGSVLVSSVDGAVFSLFYQDGGCTTQVSKGTNDYLCLLGGQFTGAKWLSARRRSLLGVSRTCNSQMKPTGVVYTEHGSKGNWILNTAEAAEMYSQMQNVPDSERASWLQSHGATYTQL
ncbi:unnamed protein product [Calypogeia fissa]